jgi:hypothetical protein
MSTSERMTSEPRLGSPTRFELNRAGAQYEVLGKIGVSDLPNWMVWFWQIQSSPAACVGDENRANLHPSDI